MVAWCQRRSDCEVLEAKFADTEEDRQIWNDCQSRIYGYASFVTPTSNEECVVSIDRMKKRCFTPAEAFYAITVDTCLPMLPQASTASELWKSFSTALPSFQREFAVEYHFRQQGWLLSSGLHYGAHFVLYRGAIDTFHSEYIVLLQDKSSGWHDVQSLSRIAADVKKTLLLLDVQITPSRTSASTTLTSGSYNLHTSYFDISGILLRSDDANEMSSIDFRPQPVLPKRKKKQQT